MIEKGLFLFKVNCSQLLQRGAQVLDVKALFSFRNQRLRISECAFSIQMEQRSNFAEMAQDALPHLQKRLVQSDRLQ
jgi:hypothetical protein